MISRHAQEVIRQPLRRLGPDTGESSKFVGNARDRFSGYSHVYVSFQAGISTIPGSFLRELRHAGQTQASQPSRRGSHFLLHHVLCLALGIVQRSHHRIL